MQTIVLELARSFDIPVRDLTPGVKYTGRFYGQDDRGVSYPECISVDGFLEILSALDAPVTEIGCHPAAVVDLDTMYRDERLTELATLCDSRVRKGIAEFGIELRSFADWQSYAPTRD